MGLNDWDRIRAHIPSVYRTEKVALGRFEIVKDIVIIGESEYPYSYIQMKPCVCILPFLEDGRVILIRQYRRSFDSWQLEIPGGGVNEGETPEDAVRRELLEETGYIADRIFPLGHYYPSPGSTTEVAYLYYGICSVRQESRCDLTEQVEVVHVTEQMLECLIAKNEFNHGMGLAAVAKYRCRRGSLL